MKTHLLIILSFFFATLNLNAQDDFRDLAYFSKQKTVEGLYLKYSSLKVLKDSSLSNYGLTHKFKRFEIKSPIKVQISCNGASEAKFDTAIAIYEIAILNDEDYHYHNLMIDSIYREWKKLGKEYWEEFKFLSKDNYLFYKEGNYVLYNFPANNNPGNYYSLWFNEHFLRVTFKGFKEKVGWGGLSSFMSISKYRDLNRLNIIEPYSDPWMPPFDFILLYEGGRFK